MSTGMRVAASPDELEIAENGILHEVVDLELRTILACAQTHGSMGETSISSS